MNELKPCPFCGGEAQTLRTGSWWCVACKTPFCCDVGKFDTEAEAIDAWNTRAERTCRLRGGECDQCGAFVHERANLYWKQVGEGMRTAIHRDVHYCPNCGAKVVE